MTSRSFVSARLALLACCVAAVVPGAAQTTSDAVFINSGPREGPAHEVAPYVSEYAAAARDMGNGMNTPEADARPSEYYFLLGAHAFRKNDFAFAIHRKATADEPDATKHEQ